MFPWSVALAEVPSVDAPLRTGESSPADAALVVGIEDYFVLGDVPYANRDATAFGDFLVYTRGVPPAKVRRLTDGANREKILRAVEEAAATVGEGGLLWVYFAGHGAASPTDGERMLLGVDAQADADSFESRAVRLSELRTRAAAGKGRLMLVLDTCYTGQGRDGGALLSGKRFAVPTWASAPPAPTVAAEWTAASPNQFSAPLPGADHGAFTWAVLGALRGWADGQLSGTRDGVVTAEEAGLFVEEALRAAQITDQVPILEAGDATGLVLARGKLERRPDLARIGVPDPTPAPAPAPAAIATPAPIPPPPPPVPAPVPGGEATICLARAKKLSGSLTGITVSGFDGPTQTVRNGGHVCVVVPAGPRDLVARAAALTVPALLKVSVEAGATAWIEVGFPQGALGLGLVLRPISQGEYDAIAGG